mgnify:FL=1
MINLKNKKVLITGATGGIGFSIVKKYYEYNSTILATGSNIGKLNELKKQFPKINIIRFDISNHVNIEKFIEDVSQKLSGLDIIVNNAGINSDNLSLRMKEEEWKKVIDINLSSTFYICKFGIKKMLKSKFGRIINITSIVGHTGNIGQSNYSATKAAIVAMTKRLA